MKFNEPTCRVCGCTQNNACPNGCWWVEEDLCSECSGTRDLVIFLEEEDEEDFYLKEHFSDVKNLWEVQEKISGVKELQFDCSKGRVTISLDDIKWYALVDSKSPAAVYFREDHKYPVEFNRDGEIIEGSWEPIMEVESDKDYSTEDVITKAIVHEFKNSELDERCQRALSQLKRMKVDTVREKEVFSLKNFSDVWWEVLHEVEMYEELENKHLSKAAAQTALRWLLRHNHLYLEYNYR